MTYHRAGNQNKDDDDEMTRKQKWNETERERDERDIIALGKEDDKRIDAIIWIREAYVMYAHLIQIYRIDADM